MKMSEPACPWCGHRMEAKELKDFCQYAAVCPRCKARGPVVFGMGARETLLAKATARALRRMEEPNVTKGDRDND